MCTICKRFKKGTLSVEEAWDELEEQSVYLNEEHIDEVEAMLNGDDEDDVYDYLRSRNSTDDDDEEYDEDDLIDYDDDELD